MVLECATQIMSLLKMISLYCNFSLFIIILAPLLKDRKPLQYMEAADEVPVSPGEPSCLTCGRRSLHKDQTESNKK